VEEMIYNFRYFTQSTMAEETKMPFTRKMITKILVLLILGTTTTNRKGYNMNLGKFFGEWKLIIMF
jgi:hypothetical protein